METREKVQLMSASEVDRTLVRLAHEILEKTADPKQLVLVGIKRRGVPLADRLARKMPSIGTSARGDTSTASRARPAARHENFRSNCIMVAFPENPELHTGCHEVAEE